MILSHIALFLFSGVLIWFCAGRLIDSVTRLAQGFRQSAFITAFFVLGLITSIGEFSVMLNSTLEGVPEISAGNLVGGKILIFLFIIPFLAINTRGGVVVKHSLTNRRLLMTLATITLPVLFLSNGTVSILEGFMCLIAYAGVAYLMRPSGSIDAIAESVRDGNVAGVFSIMKHIAIVVVGSMLIFFAGGILVEETVFLSGAFGIPSSIIGLLVLAVGTNIPELTIVVRSVQKRQAEIAFGNYIGATMTTTALFGVLAIMNGPFTVEIAQFATSLIVFAVGLILFYIFSRTNNTLSRAEGFIMLGLYAVFVFIEMSIAASHVLG